jgi:hypothetical protein
MINIIAVVVLLSALCWTQSSSGGYSTNVHAYSSQWIVVPSTLGLQSTQKLNVTIEGKKYELEAQTKGPVALLALGDYKAKLVEDAHKNSYESTQTYEIQFSDGKTRRFIVVGQTE